MAKKILKPSTAFRVGFFDGLTSTGRLVADVFSHDPKSARERSVYRGEGICGDVKAVGRDMRKAAKLALSER